MAAPLAESVRSALSYYQALLLTPQLKNPTLALGNIGILAGLVWDMTGKMSKLDTNPNTKYLLVPYALWVSYAAYLNAGIVYLNWNNTTAQTLAKK